MPAKSSSNACSLQVGGGKQACPNIPSINILGVFLSALFLTYSFVCFPQLRSQNRHNPVTALQFKWFPQFINSDSTKWNRACVAGQQPALISFLMIIAYISIKSLSVSQFDTWELYRMSLTLAGHIILCSIIQYCIIVSSAYMSVNFLIHPTWLLAQISLSPCKDRPLPSFTDTTGFYELNVTYTKFYISSFTSIS